MKTILNFFVNLIHKIDSRLQPMDYYLASHYHYSITEIQWFIKECKKIKRNEPLLDECKEIIEYAQSYDVELKDAARIYYNPNK